MKQSHFFAHLARMKLINRWPLMRNVYLENIQEHSLQVAMVAHALAVIKNKFYNGQLDANRIATIAMFHDVSEVLTGDLPNPVKYFNDAIKQEYKKIEKIAEQRLIDMTPEPLRDVYSELINQDLCSDEEKFIIKAADVICAYLKTLEELSAGNQEFTLAKKRLDSELHAYHSEEVVYFLEVFVPSFNLSLDEISLDENESESDNP